MCALYVQYIILYIIIYIFTTYYTYIVYYTYILLCTYILYMCPNIAIAKRQFSHENALLSLNWTCMNIKWNKQNYWLQKFQGGLSK